MAGQHTVSFESFEDPGALDRLPRVVVDKIRRNCRSRFSCEEVDGGECVAAEEDAAVREVKRATARRVTGRVDHSRMTRHVNHVAVRKFVEGGYGRLPSGPVDDCVDDVTVEKRLPALFQEGRWSLRHISMDGRCVGRMHIYRCSRGAPDSLGEAAVISVRMSQEDGVDVVHAAPHLAELYLQVAPVPWITGIQKREPAAFLKQIEVDPARP